MTTIEIIKEQSSPGTVVYRAVHDKLQAVGKTPGQALDALESLASRSSRFVGAYFTDEQKEEEEGTLVIVQRFRPDRFFNSSQQIRLRKLMDKFHNAVKEGESLLPEEMAELEALVNSEYQGAAERATVVLAEGLGTR